MSYLKKLGTFQRISYGVSKKGVKIYQFMSYILYRMILSSKILIYYNYINLYTGLFIHLNDIDAGNYKLKRKTKYSIDKNSDIELIYFIIKMQGCMYTTDLHVPYLKRIWLSLNPKFH